MSCQARVLAAAGRLVGPVLGDPVAAELAHQVVEAVHVVVDPDVPADRVESRAALGERVLEQRAVGVAERTGSGQTSSRLTPISTPRALRTRSMYAGVLLVRRHAVLAGRRRRARAGCGSADAVCAVQISRRIVRPNTTPAIASATSFEPCGGWSIFCVLGVELQRAAARAAPWRAPAR